MKQQVLSLLLVSLCLTTPLTFEILGQAPPTDVKIEKKEPPKPTASPTKSPSQPPPPGMDFMTRPDYKAYMDGINERNPVKKVELIEKYMADYPDSAFISLANDNLLDALVKAYPNDKERILKQSRKTLDGLRLDMVSLMGLSMVSRTYNAVVAALYKAGLNEEAEATALKAFKVFDELGAKQIAEAKRPMWLSMGQDALKNGDYKNAENYFKQSISGEYEGNTALLGLAEVAEKRKKAKQQLEYLMQADARGTLKKENRNKLEEIYLKVKGSKEGLREALDENYRRANPFPFQPAKYSPTAKRTKRTVLTELFTGSACAPCITADVAFEGIIQRYNPSDVIVLVHHLHIPGPDPMTNETTVARSRFYGGFGTPTYFINGVDKQTGGGISRKQASGFYDRIKAKIDTELEKEPDAALILMATSSNQIIKTDVSYDSVKTDTKDLKLHIVLVEHELSYMGENGIRFHPMVVRDFGGDKRTGFLLKDKSGSFSWQFDLQKLSNDLKTYLDQYEMNEKKDNPEFSFLEKKHEIDSKNLAVVAFIQDEKTKKILQSAFFDLAQKKK